MIVNLTRLNQRIGIANYALAPAKSAPRSESGNHARGVGVAAMPDLREAIQRFDIVGFSAQFIDILRDYGTDVIADCPICQGKRKLYISRNKRIVRCFTCDEMGLGGDTWTGRADLIQWITILQGCSRREAVELVMTSSGFVYVPEIVEQKDYTFPREALRISENCNYDHPCRVELRRRNLEHLMDHWYMCPTGKYSGRFILPVRYFDKQLGFEAKSYSGHTPKSLSMCEPDSLYSTVCWDKARPFAVITESIFDAETVGVNALGLMGSGMSADRFARLLDCKKHGVEELIWLLDADAFDKQRRLIERWGMSRFRNKFAMTPDGLDPNAMGLQKCWDCINAAKPINSVLDLAVL